MQQIVPLIGAAIANSNNNNDGYGPGYYGPGPGYYGPPPGYYGRLRLRRLRERTETCKGPRHG